MFQANVASAASTETISKPLNHHRFLRYVVCLIIGLLVLFWFDNLFVISHIVSLMLVNVHL